MTQSSGTGPQKRESSEAPRLSPSMKKWPARDRELLREVAARSASHGCGPSVVSSRPLRISLPPRIAIRSPPVGHDPLDEADRPPDRPAGSAHICAGGRRAAAAHLRDVRLRARRRVQDDDVPDRRRADARGPRSGPDRDRRRHALRRRAVEPAERARRRGSRRRSARRARNIPSARPGPCAGILGAYTGRDGHHQPPRPRAAAARRPARLLRRRRPRRPDRRARARALRRAGLRAQGDRPQQARRRPAARARRDLRRGARRLDPRGRDHRLLRPRRLARPSTPTPSSATCFTLDATCPLVTKVHVEAKKFAAEGYTIVLIGHAGHEEVEGTMGEAPEHIVLVETEADVDALEVEDPERVAYISQTTLSVDETRAIIDRLREKFPRITGPRTDDICYATTNRQAAVKQMAAECDLVLVIGSQNSSNSQRLVDVARDLGADAHLIDNEAPGPRRVARGQARGRHHLRRERARGARPAPRRRSSATAAPRTSRSSRSCARTCASCCRRPCGRPSPRATRSAAAGNVVAAD